MQFSFSFNHEDKIIFYQHKGFIDKNDIGQAWTELLQMPEFTALGYNLLSDYREATFNLVKEDTTIIAEFLQSLKSILRGKSQAFLIASPHDFAMTILFENKVYQKVGFIVKTFSSEKEALRWLNAYR